MYNPNILVPEYHQEQLANIHRDTMQQIMSTLIFMEHGSTPNEKCVNFLSTYVTDQLSRFNMHIDELKKLKTIPIVSPKIVQNFNGTIQRFIQVIRRTHEQN